MRGPARRLPLRIRWNHKVLEQSGVESLCLPNPDGTFRAARLVAAFEEQDWAGYVFIAAPDRHAGFAIVRSLDAPVRVLSSFFVVRSMRRAGVGLQAAGTVISEHPGPWEVAFQVTNAAATRFWRRVATELAGSDWTQERRAVPGMPDLPPDVWISFTVGPAASLSPRSTRSAQGGRRQGAAGKPD